MKELCTEDMKRMRIEAERMLSGQDMVISPWSPSADFYFTNCRKNSYIPNTDMLGCLIEIDRQRMGRRLH